MTNTFMLDGEHDPEEILKTVKDGIYAVNFSGGQVDITSGKFVFNCTEAYRVKNGVVGAPIKKCRPDWRRPHRADTRFHDRKRF